MKFYNLGDKSFETDLRLVYVYINEGLAGGRSFEMNLSVH